MLLSFPTLAFLSVLLAFSHSRPHHFLVQQQEGQRKPTSQQLDAIVRRVLGRRQIDSSVDDVVVVEEDVTVEQASIATRLEDKLTSFIEMAMGGKTVKEVQALKYLPHLIPLYMQLHSACLAPLPEDSSAPGREPRRYKLFPVVQMSLKYLLQSKGELLKKALGAKIAMKHAEVEALLQRL